MFNAELAHLHGEEHVGLHGLSLVHVTQTVLQLALASLGALPNGVVDGPLESFLVVDRLVDG